MDLNSILNTGIDPTTGKYLTSEERKKAFKKSMGMGYASATKKGTKKPPIKPQSALVKRDKLERDRIKKESALVKQQNDKLGLKLELLTKLVNNLFQMRSERVRLESKYAETQKKVKERESKKSEEQSMESSGGRFGSKFLNKVGKKAAEKVGFGLFSILKAILTYGILDWISKPENKEAVLLMVKGLMGVFKVFSFFVGTAVNATLGGFTKLFGGGSILERIFGFFEMLFGIFLFRRILNPLKLLGDLKWAYKNIGNFKDLFKALSGKNLSKAGDAVKKIFPTAASLFKKGIQGAVQRIFLKVFGKGITKFIKPIAKTIIKTVVRPLAGFVKRVPVVGTLLAIPINMFLGDPIDKAVVKAIGATLGTFVVGALGSIIPGAGTVLGGLAGGLLGDWLAGWLYDGVIAPLGKTIQKSMPQLNTGGIASGPDSGYKVTLHGEEVVIPVNKLASTILMPYKTVASAVIGGTLGVLKSMGSVGALMGPIALQMFNPFIRIFGFTKDTFASGLGKGANLLMGPASAAEFQAGDEYPSDSAEDSDEDDQKDKSEKDDASNGDKPAPVPTGPIPQGKSADFWTLAAVASREDGDPQGQADVAQSIYNRLASGAYGGKTIKDLLISTWQYEPTWRYPNGPTRGDGNPNPQWLNISDIKSAAAAVGASENHVASAAKAITNSGLQAKAAEFVQGRTDFTGYSKRARRGQIQRKRGDNYFGWDFNYSGKGIAKVPSFSGVKLASAGGIIPLFMSGGGEYNPKSGMVQPSMKDFNFIPNEEAITDRKKKMSMILQSLAGGGMIKVDGDGSGWTGTLSMYQGGAKVGKSYKARSGISSKRNVSQKDRFHTKMSPHPDGTYSLVGADYHGHIMAGLGDWSVYIGNSSGSLGSRSGLMFHNDIGNNGTAGCIGIDVGGAAGTKADKDFWKQYQEIKPSKMLINLLGKGAGKVDDLGDQSSGPASNSSSQTDSPASDDKKEEKVDPGFMGSGASIEQLKYLMANLGMTGGGGSGSAPTTPSAPPPSSALPSMSSNFTLDKKMSSITSKISNTTIIQQGSTNFGALTITPLPINTFITTTDVLNKL